MSCAEDDHGGAAVQSVTRSHDLSPRLSKQKYFTLLKKIFAKVSPEERRQARGGPRAASWRWRRWIRWRPGSRCWSCRPGGRRRRCTCPGAPSPPLSHCHSPAARQFNFMQRGIRPVTIVTLTSAVPYRPPPPTSDTRRHEAYEDRSMLMKRSLASTSSFLTSSPWHIQSPSISRCLSPPWPDLTCTLVLPAAPKRLEMPALLTAVDTALHADWMLDSSCVRSPTMSISSYLLFLFYLLPEVKSLSILFVFDLLYTIYPPLRKNVQFHRQRKLLKCKLSTFDITNLLKFT